MEEIQDMVLQRLTERKGVDGLDKKVFRNNGNNVFRKCSKCELGAQHCDLIADAATGKLQQEFCSFLKR